MSIPVVRNLNLPGRHVLIEESVILQRIQQMGREVQVHLDKHPMRTVFVGVLTGATRFTMTFIEELNPNSFTYDFVKVHRYKNSQEGGEATVMFDGVSEQDIAGSRVILMDDIADERITNACLIKHYLKRGAAEVKVCVLLNKFERKHPSVQVPLDWVGFDIPNVFVWGWGLDDSSNPMTRNDHDVCYWGKEIDPRGFMYQLPTPITMSA